MLFWVPGIASVILFLLLSANGVLTRPGVVGAWCAAGVILQLVAGVFSPVWLAGLLINVATALYLAVQVRLM